MPPRRVLLPLAVTVLLAFPACAPLIAFYVPACEIALRGTAEGLACLVSHAIGSHARPSVPVPPRQYGNPDGYRVYWLSGDSLSSRTATINGIVIDVASVQSIDSSVQSIREWTFAPRTIEEVSGQPVDASIDFTRPAVPVPPMFHGADLDGSSKHLLHDPRWRALVSHLKLGFLRFPGGEEPVRYHRSPRTSATEEDSRAGVGEESGGFQVTGEDVAAFIALCRETGAEAAPELNLTENDEVAWAAMVEEIVNELGYDLKYFSVDGEPGVRPLDGSLPCPGTPLPDGGQAGDGAPSGCLDRLSREIEEAGASSTAAAHPGAPGTLAAALWDAEVQERRKLAEPGSVEGTLGSSYELRSLLSMGDDAAPRPLPQYYLYLLYRYLYGSEAVKVQSGDHGDWSLHAARDDSQSFLLLVNRTESETFTPVVAVTTFAGDRQLRLTSYPHSLSVIAF
jgi:hypothetical protein